MPVAKKVPAKARKHPEDVLVDEIAQGEPSYAYHPQFRRAVIQAKNLVRNYLQDQHGLEEDTITAKDLRQEPNRNLIEKIACAIHSARIERGY